MGIIAVTLTSGCLRFGYDRQETPDALAMDAGTDAAAQDAAAPGAAGAPAEMMDASARDAAQPDAARPAPDAATISQDSGMDAAVSGGPPDASDPDAGAGDASAADSGTPDAGTIDAAMSDAAMEAGTTDPCIGRTDLLFCGGFDDSAAWGPSVASNGTVTTTTQRARWGSTSLRAATAAASSSTSMIARREATVFNAQKSGDVWARAFFYLPSSVVIDPASKIAIMRITESQSPYDGCSVVIRPDYVELGGVTTRYRALSPFPRDRWTCVELHIQIDDDSDGACNAYVDEMQSAQALDADTLPASGYTLLWVGLEYANAAQGPVELYIDDVAADDTRVGCD